MPSLVLSDPILSETPKDKKEKKNKKMKNGGETLATDSLASEKNLKKEGKKRKALEIEDEDQRSDTSSELVEPMNWKSEESEENKKKKMRKAKVDEEEDPNAVSRFRISEQLRARLKEKGIESLFPIQAMTFDTILDGSDLVGRARTGQVYFLRKSFLIYIFIFTRRHICLFVFLINYIEVKFKLDYPFIC